jgi:hypothetical protein
MKKSFSPPQSSAPVTHESTRIDRAMRAFAKSLVYLPSSRGDKVEFDAATQDKLLNALNRVKPTPSQRSITRMVELTNRIVSDLNNARDKVKKTSESDIEKDTLRNLFSCAEKMRQACEDTIANEQSKYALNSLLKLGVIKLYDKNLDSEAGLIKTLKEIENADLFGKFYKRLIAQLDLVIKSTTSLVNDLEAAKRITNYPDYRFASVLAYNWSRILGAAPTFTNLDGQAAWKKKPSPFQAFATALPLHPLIEEEALRTAVEIVGDIWTRTQAPKVN